MMVPYPEGKEFESGHGQLGNPQVGVTAKGATNIVDLAIAELGDGRSVLKKLVVVKGGGYAVIEAKDMFVKRDKVGSSVGILSHFQARVDVDKVKFVSTGSNSWS
jgi:hypothetical protein